MMLAALCHFYPAYTLDDLRGMPVRDIALLVEAMQEMTRGR